MTPAMRSLMAAAALTFVAAPAYADCDVINFPETHISKNANADELREMATKLNEVNKQINDYNTCIDKMVAEPQPANMTDEQKTERQAQIDMHVKAHDMSLDHLIAAAEEYKKAANAYNKKHPENR